MVSPPSPVHAGRPPGLRCQSSGPGGRSSGPSTFRPPPVVSSRVIAVPGPQSAPGSATRAPPGSPGPPTESLAVRPGYSHRSPPSPIGEVQSWPTPQPLPLTTTGPSPCAGAELHPHCSLERSSGCGKPLLSSAGALRSSTGGLKAPPQDLAGRRGLGQNGSSVSAPPPGAAEVLTSDSSEPKIP